MQNIVPVSLRGILFYIINIFTVRIGKNNIQQTLNFLLIDIYFLIRTNVNYYRNLTNYW